MSLETCDQQGRALCNPMTFLGVPGPPLAGRMDDGVGRRRAPRTGARGIALRWRMAGERRWFQPGSAHVSADFSVPGPWLGLAIGHGRLCAEPQVGRLGRVATTVCNPRARPAPAQIPPLMCGASRALAPERMGGVVNLSGLCRKAGSASGGQRAGALCNPIPFLECGSGGCGALCWGDLWPLRGGFNTGVWGPAPTLTRRGVREADRPTQIKGMGCRGRRPCPPEAPLNLSPLWDNSAPRG